MSESRLESTSWNGSAVHVEDAGTGPVALLLHSSGMSGEQWRRTAEGLRQEGMRTIVPDFLGSGRSAAWPEGKPFEFGHDVDVVAGLLREIGQPVHLVGHSYGGFIALQAALREPARVLSMALYDPVAFGVLDPEADADAFAERATLSFHWGETAAEHEAWLQSFVGYWSGAEAWPRLREAARAEMIRVGWIVYSGARSLVGDGTPAAAYRPVAVPTTLVTGDGSPIAAQRIVARLGEALAGARVERLPGAGHMGPLTHGKVFTERLAAHLAAARR
jgi:pimeloyl-ACP methyl ester carboxylesterase